MKPWKCRAACLALTLTLAVGTGAAQVLGGVFAQQRGMAQAFERACARILREMDWYWGGERSGTPEYAGAMLGEAGLPREYTFPGGYPEDALGRLLAANRLEYAAAGRDTGGLTMAALCVSEDGDAYREVWRSHVLLPCDLAYKDAGDTPTWRVVLDGFDADEVWDALRACGGKRDRGSFTATGTADGAYFYPTTLVLGGRTLQNGADAPEGFTISGPMQGRWNWDEMFRNRRLFDAAMRMAARPATAMLAEEERGADADTLRYAGYGGETALPAGGKLLVFVVHDPLARAFGESWPACAAMLAVFALAGLAFGTWLARCLKA